LRIEILLHHEEGRQYRDEHVKREERRLQRIFDVSVGAPGPDRDTAKGDRILPVNPILSTSGGGGERAPLPQPERV